jgi:hypothetical protein
MDLNKTKEAKFSAFSTKFEKDCIPSFTLGLA